MNLELLVSTTHGFVVLKNEKQYNKALNILEKNGFDIESVENIVCFEEGVTDCLEVYGDISFGIFDSWMKNHVDYTEYGFEEIFGNEVSFKTEIELIKHCEKEKLAIKINNIIEYNCLEEILKRNGYKTTMIGEVIMEVYDFIYIVINVIDKHGRHYDYRWDNNYEYLEKNKYANGYVEFETMYGWLE